MIGKDDKIKRAALWAPAKLYELGVRLRVAAYETEYLRPRRLESVVISVGNLTHGGTGKTPLVEFIARYLRQQYHQVAILTRGYARKSAGRRVLNAPSPSAAPAAASYHEYGDEPLMLSRALPDVPIVIDSNRYAGGRWAESRLGSQVLILDDGYQHLALERDLNVLLLDATDPFGGFEMAPFGRLREPLYGLKRADLVIVTRADRPFDHDQTLRIIRYFCGEDVPVIYVASSITRMRHLATGEPYDVNQLAGWKVLATCGIGNPRAFVEDVEAAGLAVLEEFVFRDHYSYSQEDLDRMTKRASEVGADAIVTTAKDAVRLQHLRHGDVPIYEAQLELQTEDEVRLKSLVLRTAIRR